MKNKSKINNTRGFSTVLFALTITVVMGFAALVIDVGMVMVQKQKLQNAIDAASLAAASELPDRARAINVANEYMELNGFDSSYVNYEFLDGDNALRLTVTKDINFFFAKAIGFDGMTTTLNTVASSQSLGEAFNYVLFSGSKSDTLKLNGSNFYIEGNTHTNGKFNINGSNQTITGTCEASSTITTNGSDINIGSKVPYAKFVEMPDFSATIKSQAEECEDIYSGNKTYDESHVSVDKSILVDGDLIINGSNFSGEGSILVDDDIIFNGSSLAQNEDTAVCFYSENGDIVINGSNAEIHGILYAPNGTITLNGSNQTIYGRVIANKVRFNGSNSQIIGGTAELRSLPSHGSKLTR